jgi:hypothetical protein
VGDVIDHMGEVMDIARGPNETKSYVDRVLQYLGIEKFETGRLPGKEAQEKDLREKVQENFVESRMQVLDWIRDGLSIGGTMNVARDETGYPLIVSDGSLTPLLLGYRRESGLVDMPLVGTHQIVDPVAGLFRPGNSNRGCF